MPAKVVTAVALYGAKKEPLREAVRQYLAEHPVEVDVGIGQVTVIASDSPTLAPARFIGRIPGDRAEILELFR